MISIGVQLGGPESVAIEALLRAAMTTMICARGEKGDDASPEVNVVFYVPGSLLQYADLRKIEATRFSRKERLLLVAVPVPTDVAHHGGSVRFLIDALHQAIAIAAEAFARKGLVNFDIHASTLIVDRVEQMLRDRQDFSSEGQ
jgi:hypothetical protein